MAYSGEVENACGPFEGKRITVMGLGLLGRGVGDAEFLAGCGAEVLVTDQKSQAELSESIGRLKKYPNVAFRLGGHVRDDFTDCDMVVKAAGVLSNSPYIEAAREAGVDVLMSTALFAHYAAAAGATIVGVTGTRGKSTVTHMIYNVLKASGIENVLLGGNVRGVSTLALLPRVERGTIAVLELDSWQLQGFGELKMSPAVAVFTNLSRDHMNYYGGDMDAYFSDKANIFRYQKEGDSLIVGRSIESRVREAKPPIEPVVPGPLPDDWHLKIPGGHNRENAALAAAALRSLGVREEDIRRGIEAFEGVEGRLQFAGETNGVKIYNDNNATTPDATIAALNALDPDGTGNIVLIIGGADKGLDMSAMRGAVHARCKKVFFLAGTGTERIRADAPDAPVFDSLSAAFDAALKAAVTGDIILFSPAFASFGMFKNEYDRNDQFMRIVKARL